MKIIWGIVLGLIIFGFVVGLTGGNGSLIVATVSQAIPFIFVVQVIVWLFKKKNNKTQND